MAILKKSCKCQRCGELMPAGTKISWEQGESTIRNAHGFVQARKVRWIARHEQLADCEAYGAKLEAERIAACKARGIPYVE